MISSKTIRLNVVFILTICILGLQSAAAQSKTDVLELQISKTKTDSTRARLLNELAWELKFIEPQKAVKLVDEAIALSRKLHLTREISNGFKVKAHTSLSNHEILQGLILYDSAIHYAHLSKDLLLEAQCLNKKAGAMGDMGNYANAINLYSQGLELALKLKNNDLLSVFYNNLADAYQNLGRNSGLVQSYYLLALKYSIASKNLAAACLNSSNLAKEYSSQKLTSKAKLEIERSKSLLKRTPYGSYLYGAACKEIASVNEDLGNLPEAKEFALISYHILDSLKMNINALGPMQVLTSISIKTKEWKVAHDMAAKLLRVATENQAALFIQNAYLYLSQIAQFQGNYQQALAYYQNYKTWSDSVFFINFEKNTFQKELNAALAKHDLEQKFKLKLKVEENKILFQQNKVLKVSIVVTSIALAILAILGIWLYKSIKSKQMLNTSLILQNNLVAKQAMEKTVLIQEIHHRVKNNLTMLQSMFYLQAKNSSDPQVKQVLEDSQSRIVSMALVHQYLYENDNDGHLDLLVFVNKLLDLVTQANGHSKTQNVHYQLTGDSTKIGIQLAIPLGLILNELITNTMKHAVPVTKECTIEIHVSIEHDRIKLSYLDNGPGIPQSLNTKEAGFGFKMIHLLSDQIRAKLHVLRENHSTKFILEIPYDLNKN